MVACVEYRLPFSVNACELYDMGKSVFLAFCPKIYTPDTGPVMRSFDGFFVVSLKHGPVCGGFDAHVVSL